MRELGRILSRRRLALGLVAILLLNGLLFVREQRKRDFGLDLTLPSTGGIVYFDGTFEVTQEPVDARAALRRYSEWLDRARAMPLADAVPFLNDEKTAISGRLAGDDGSENDRLDFVAVNNILSKTDYLTGYGDWLASIQKNKENLLTFSLFNDPNSFSGRNIIKTAEEFEKLQNVELELGADGAVEAFMTFKLTDYFLLLTLLIVALSFLDERKAGLWAVVHASPRGRVTLSARRALILLGASVIAVTLLYGTDLALGFYIYGGAEDLDRAVQSVETLGKLTSLTTVGGFLLRYFLLRVAAAFLVSLLLWLMLTAVNNVKYTVIVAATALAAEYGLYAFLPVQSAFNLLKYFNLFTYISLSDLYTNYLNIDVFGYPLGIRSVSQLALPPLCAVLTCVCVYVNSRKKPAAGRDLLGRAAYKLNSLTDRFLRRLHLFGMELHKTLWLQKGVVILALLVYVVSGLSYTVSVSVKSMAEQAAKQYTAEFAGPITEDTLRRIEAEQRKLDDIKNAFEDAKAAFDSGLIEYPELDKYSRDASSAQVKSEGLDTVRARVEELREKGEAEGFAPWLIDETPFESVYGPAAELNQQKAALAAVLALTLLLAGCLTYERQSGMTCLLSSTVRGRGALTLRKLMLVLSMTVPVWALVYGAEVYALFTKYDMTALPAPAKNISMLSQFPLNCSVAGWLTLLYVFRLLMLLCVGVIVLFISGLCRRPERACVAACAVAVLPSALYAYVGVPALRPLSVILPIETMPLLTPSSASLTPLLPWLSTYLPASLLSALSLFSRRRRI